MAPSPPVVLTIAGFDPSSGAGVTADIKTIAAHDCFGVACITALTVQSTQGVHRIEPVAPATIRDTLAELTEDIDVAAIHIGMLGSAAVAAEVARFLETRPDPPVVLDPILKSTSGAQLLDPEGLKLMVERLLLLVDVITPNLDEASLLTGIPISNSSQMGDVARLLHSMGAANVVITGGDLEKATDLLSFTTPRGIEQETFKSQRQKSSSTHGTGCAFSTALACHLAHQRGLPEAVLLSKAYVSAAIANAYPVGRGKGPLHHLYRMTRTRRDGIRIREEEAAPSRN